MKASSKHILPFALLLAAGLLILGLQPEAIPVTAAPVLRGSFTESIEEEGRTVLRHPRVLHAPVSGDLRQLRLEEGDDVREGQILFEVEPPPSPPQDARSLAQLEAEAAAAEAALRAASAQHAARASERSFAEREVERNLSLQASRVISPSEMDRLHSRLALTAELERAAEQEVERLGHQLRGIRAALEMPGGTRIADPEVLPVVSPLEGVVLSIHRRDGGPVAAGSPVLVLGSLEDLEVRVDLLSMDAVRIRESMPVILTRWGGEEDLHGVVRRVEPVGFERVSALGVEEQRVPVWITLQTPRGARPRLGTDYRVEAQFLLWQGEEVLHIPTSALFRLEGGAAVFVIREGRAEIRTVLPGRRDGLRTQILDGLSEGETVIAHPSDRVSAGRRIRVDE